MELIITEIMDYAFVSVSLVASLKCIYSLFIGF